MGKDFLHFVGDSHASFFTGIESRRPTWPEKSKCIISNFKTYNIGPATAYNLCEENTTVKGREQLFKLLKREIPKRANVVLCFGEIDCRGHILKKAKEENIDPYDLVSKTAERYFNVVLEVKSMKEFNVSVWNIVPSSYIESRPNSKKQRKWPIFGSVQERNKITKAFNNLLKLKCQEHGLVFIDVFDNFVDENLLSKEDFYRDIIHLNQKAMPIVIEELKKYFNL